MHEIAHTDSLNRMRTTNSSTNNRERDLILYIGC